MKRSGTKVMLRLIGLVKPLTGWMILAILMGLAGHLCASGITVLGGYAVLELLQVRVGIGLAAVFAGVSIFAVLRGLLRYGEQSCNHYIAFKLLACCVIGCFRLCAGCARQSWREEIEEI